MKSPKVEWIGDEVELALLALAFVGSLAFYNYQASCQLNCHLIHSLTFKRSARVIARSEPTPALGGGGAIVVVVVVDVVVVVVLLAQRGEAPLVC